MILNNQHNIINKYYPINNIVINNATQGNQSEISYNTTETSTVKDLVNEIYKTLTKRDNQKKNTHDQKKTHFVKYAFAVTEFNENIHTQQAIKAKITEEILNGQWAVYNNTNNIIPITNITFNNIMEDHNIDSSISYQKTSKSTVKNLARNVAIHLHKNDTKKTEDVYVNNPNKIAFVETMFGTNYDNKTLVNQEQIKQKIKEYVMAKTAQQDTNISDKYEIYLYNKSLNTNMKKTNFAYMNDVLHAFEKLKEYADHCSYSGTPIEEQKYAHRLKILFSTNIPDTLNALSETEKDELQGNTTKISNFMNKNQEQRKNMSQEKIVEIINLTNEIQAFDPKKRSASKDTPMTYKYRDDIVVSKNTARKLFETSKEPSNQNPFSSDQIFHHSLGSKSKLANLGKNVLNNDIDNHSVISQESLKSKRSKEKPDSMYSSPNKDKTRNQYISLTERKENNICSNRFITRSDNKNEVRTYGDIKSNKLNFNTPDVRKDNKDDPKSTIKDIIGRGKSQFSSYKNRTTNDNKDNIEKGNNLF